MYTYLIINAIAIGLPMIATFFPWHRFDRKWKYVFPAILLTMIIFIPWDIAFTDAGVWGFNPKYLSGIYIFNLPLGEWLFFICIPYATLFTYDAMNFMIRKDVMGRLGPWLAGILGIGFLVVGFANLDKLYTFITFISTGLFLLLHLLVLRSKYMGRFFLAYGVVIIPFLIINGILTGSHIEEQVVWYNDAENLGIKIFTIPVDDFVYSLLLQGLNVTFFETFQRKY